ncbi:MAG: type 1 secretion C-terminal target domain subclass, partial [Solirubrobacterales bacterium]|nr:type 1 secretion C-terminal target domain subclass [Solirubrobacterales bacterium]
MVVVLVALLSLALAPHSNAAPECTIEWTAVGSGSWHEAANWSETGKPTVHRVPGASDKVCIPSGVTVEVLEAAGSVLSVQSKGTLAISSGSLALTENGSTTANLTQSGGTLGGTGTVTVSGAVSWTGGSEAGKGATVVASGGTLSITSATGTTFLEAERVLQINSGATATMGSSALLYLAENAQVQNAGTFNANGNETSSAGIYANGGGGQLFHNTGTLTRSGTGIFRVTVPFDNDGTVNASVGTLSLENGGGAGSATGSFTGSGEKGLVGFAAGAFALASGASLSGRVELSGGTLEAIGSANVAHSGGTFTQSSGTLGGTGTFTFSSAFTWSGGSQAGKGTTVLASGGALSLTTATTNTFLEAERTLKVNSGATATMSANAILYLAESAQVQNAGTFNANGNETASAGIYANGGGGQLFHNTGTLTRSGTGAFRVTVPFENEGTVNIIKGVLRPNSYPQSSGGTLDVHIGGTEPGTGFGQLSVEGTATLAGTLQITTESAFKPKAGDTFRIINASVRSGTFSVINGTEAGTGLTYEAKYDATGVTLTVVSGFTPPTVATKPASAVAQTAATLNATVNPNGTNVTDCKFEYGTTNAYGSSVACSALPGAGTAAVAVSAGVSGLAANTVYHFRISATNAGGTSKGVDESFTT